MTNDADECIHNYQNDQALVRSRSLLRIKISNILSLFLISLKVAAVAANCESNVRIHLTGH